MHSDLLMAKVKKTYPSFEKPSLAEAICELRYAALTPEALRRAPGKLLPALQNAYPLLDVQDETPFKLAIDGRAISENINSYRFSNEDNKYTITVRKDAFVFSLIPDEKNEYDWPEFKKKLCTDWPLVAEALQIEEIHRVGIRFINILEIDANINNSDYLSADCDYIPKRSVLSQRAFFNRQEFSTDDENRFIIMTGAQTKAGKETKDIIVDIDRITERTAIAAEELSEVVENMHEDIEEVFFHSITDTYKKRMKPKE